MALSDELVAIRLELKGVRETVEGFKSVDKAQESVGRSTTKAGTAASRAERKTSGLTRAYQSLGKTARWGLGFLGVGGVFALKSAVEHSEELAKTTTGLSRNLGLQTNVASRWGAVAQARDIDSKSLTMSFTTLSRKMVEAGRTGGTLLTPFHQLGLTQADAAKGAHDFEWGLMRVGKALGDAHGGSVRQAAAQQLLGRGYQAILPLFSEGTKGLQEQLHWADKYGVTLDGKTNKSLMDMVQAQRESKVATLGLQLALTKALMPAIEGGQHELQKFIQTLNDPKMSGDEKIAAIERQFGHLEDKLLDVLTAALPSIAEHGGELGEKLAVALWTGFIHSDTLGKLVIGAWLFHAMGGFSAIGVVGARVGGKLATSLGWKFLTTVAPYFAAEAGVEGLGAALASQMGGLTALFRVSGGLLGTAMGLAAATALAAEIAFAVTHREELFGPDLVFTPKLDAASIEEASMKYRERGYKDIGYINGHEFQATTPSGKHVIVSQKGHKWVQHAASGGSHGKHHGGHSNRLPRAVTQRAKHLPAQSLPRDGRGWGRSRLRSVTVQVPLDGKVIAEKTVDIADLEASLK